MGVFPLSLRLARSGQEGEPASSAFHSPSNPTAAVWPLDVFQASAGPTMSDVNPTTAAAGLYEVARASLLTLSTSSLSLAIPSTSADRGWRSASSVSQSVGAGRGNLLGRLERALDALGLDATSAKQLLLIARLLERLDPRAFQSLVYSLEGLAQSLSARTASATQSPSQSAVPQVQLDLVVLQISVSESSVSESSGDAGAQVSAQQLDIRFERIQLTFRQQPAAQADPLVLDLSGDGVNLRPTSDGVQFDITGSGQAVRTAFVQGDDALLFYDANRNGTLDDGSEWVGNRLPGMNAGQELAALDENHDGKITTADAAYDRLRLYRDLDGDGSTAPSEVQPLRALGVEEISALLASDPHEERHGIQRVARSTFTRADQTRGAMFDFLFSYLPA